MIVRLLTEHNLEFLSLKRGCTGSSESTLVKMPHCWKSHATAHLDGFNPLCTGNPEMGTSANSEDPGEMCYLLQVM